ncbi:hypothetical protein ACJMK2_029148 [Sinanodonta woodiana]|uniref:Photolyase/cryptochrome alpha/beta domain-containing protein n=1 Tax=Sinanodonta woodiana TaxID=1069815 RepID=A0ABD3X9A7_SINWO
MDEPSKKYVIHWFRKGLRLHDNPALCEAFKGASTFRCVYILDPWFAGVSQVGINKWRFLLQCLEDLDSSLRKVNSRLFVIRGQPTDVFPRLFKEWNITTLSFEEDPEPFGKERDAAISAMAKEAGVEVIVRMSHTLFNLQKIITENNGTPPLTFKRFQSILKTIGPPTKPVETVTLTTIGTARTPIENDHDDRYGVPSLEELGFDVDGLKPSLFHGGETEALLRLDRHLERKAWVASFEKPKMTSQSLLPSQTTISPYLKFGCLSPRLFYWKLNDLYRRATGRGYKKKKRNKPVAGSGLRLPGTPYWMYSGKGLRLGPLRTNYDTVITQLNDVIAKFNTDFNRNDNAKGMWLIHKQKSLNVNEFILEFFRDTLRRNENVTIALPSITNRYRDINEHVNEQTRLNVNRVIQTFFGNPPVVGSSLKLIDDIKKLTDDTRNAIREAQTKLERLKTAHDSENINNVVVVIGKVFNAYSKLSELISTAIDDSVLSDIEFSAITQLYNSAVSKLEIENNPADYNSEDESGTDTVTSTDRRKYRSGTNQHDIDNINAARIQCELPIIGSSERDITGSAASVS